MHLAVIATPIGNLKDCSPRAIESLAQATLIIAEDTRTSGQLLKLLGIEGKKGICFKPCAKYGSCHGEIT